MEGIKIFLEVIFMKKILSAVTIFCVMIFSANCQADSVTKIKPIIGTWYDMNGNPTLTISSDYSINGCKILDYIEIGGDYDSSVCEVKIFEKTGLKNLRIEHWHCLVSNDVGDENFHEIISIDKKIPYRRTKNQKYIESVGGIYLGMTESAVLKLYGEPSYKEINSDFRNSFELEYKNLGLLLSFDNGIVKSIKIFDYGDRKFDKSGLSARDSIESYRKFYKPITNNTYIIRGEAIYIGNGETIFFGENFVTLY